MKRDTICAVALAAAVSGHVNHVAGVIIQQREDGGFSAYRADSVEREWDDARLHAASTQFAGVPGHLVTITSLAEQRRVEQLVFTDAWLGLTDADAHGGIEYGDVSRSPQPLLGSGAVPAAGERGAGWRWITGEPLRFQYWANAEPNDSGGEDAAHIRSDGQWNDNSAGTALGQPGTALKSLIEYDLPAGGPPTDVFKVKWAKHYNGVTNLAVADAVLGGIIPSDSFTGELAVLNLRDTGVDGFAPGGLPVPGLTQDVDDNHFVSRNIATLDVAQAGIYSFFFNSDDGGRMLIDGEVIAESFGTHGPTAVTGLPVNLSAGLHTFELIWFENSGGAMAEAAYAPGAKGAPDFDFRLIGDPSAGISVVGSIQSTTMLVTLSPDFNIYGPANTPGFQAAQALLDGVTPAVTTEFFSDVLNFTDVGTDPFFGGNDAFPGLLETNRANFALEATALLDIVEGGLFTFGTRSSAGARVTIDGVIVIDDESMSDRNAFGSIALTPGLHTIEVLYFSDGENTELELFAARGLFTAFDAGAFRLVGDVESGGLRITQATAAAVPEPMALWTVVALGISVRRPRIERRVRRG